MEILHGLALRRGIAIASAARLREEYGVFSLAPQRLRRLGERLRQFGVEVAENEQVILIADRIPSALANITVPGIEIVGVAAQADNAPALTPDCPSVIGLGETLLSLVDEEDIVIVDGDRGRVYLAPDAATVARYQAPFTLARRYFLEGVHLPARTASEGRTITVLALAESLPAIEEAMAAGADGIFVPNHNTIIGEDTPQTAGEQAATLLKMARMIAGLPLFLGIPSEYLALSALSRAAAACPLHLILNDPEEVPEMRGQWRHIEESLEEQDILFGMVQLERGDNTRNEERPQSDALEGFSGIFVVEASVDHLPQIAALAQRAGKPASTALPRDDWREFLYLALDLGFSRVIARSSAVSEVKDAIRGH